jgi:hypothetical protein
MSPALIFDEFEEEPFTENRRWRDSDLKIHTHPQTATDFVGVKAIVRLVCRSGQPCVCKLSRQRLESACGFSRLIAQMWRNALCRQPLCDIPAGVVRG